MLQLITFTPQQPPIQVRWTEEQVKRLLLTPHALLRDRPWHDWIAHHGGLEAVYERLTTIPLAPQQRELLLLVLQEPSSWRK